jgi:hypothetical protein
MTMSGFKAGLEDQVGWNVSEFIRNRILVLRPVVIPCPAGATPDFLGGMRTELVANFVSEVSVTHSSLIPS